MKKGQILSQPFIYIFAIIVIGLILLFGFRYIGKILKTGCEIESLDLVNDIQAEANQLRALSFGSSYKCSFSYSGTGDRCNFIIPSNVEGLCFVDLTRGQHNQIPERFKEVKEIAELIRNDDRNLFFIAKRGSNCEAEPARIKNLEIQTPLCIDLTGREGSFIMENAGNKVLIKRD